MITNVEQREKRHRILVVNVAASVDGAVSIMNIFYRRFLADLNNDYIVCVSVIDLASTSNVSVLNFPWVKKSWFHRLYFDYVIAPRLIKKYSVDEILSLQNTAIPFTKKKQTIYLHQALPFASRRFSFLRYPKLWIYQSVIGKLIKRSLKKANAIIVQSDYLASTIEKKLNISRDRIHVESPNVTMTIDSTFDWSDWNADFFYPASAHIYKNHITLFKAAQLLNDRREGTFKITLTLSEEELPKPIRHLYESLRETVVLKGKLSVEEMKKMYAKSVLVFPSLIESYGLPLLEAKLHGAPIIASSEPFAQDVLKNYEQVVFFASEDEFELAKCIESMLSRSNEKTDLVN